MKFNKEDAEMLKRIDFGVRRGVARALAEHKKAGHSIFVWRNDKIVEIPPAEIHVPDVKMDDIVTDETAGKD
jgi:hypothetical protein